MGGQGLLPATDYSQQTLGGVSQSANIKLCALPNISSPFQINQISDSRWTNNYILCIP